MPCGQAKVIVKIKIDESGILQISAVDKTSNDNSKKLEI